MNPAPSQYSMYYENFILLEDAKKREKFLKYFGRAYGQLKKRIMNCLNMNL